MRDVELLKPAEVAEKLKVSVDTVHEMLADRRLVGTSLGPRMSRVYAESLSDYLLAKAGARTLAGWLPHVYGLGADDSYFLDLADDLEFVLVSRYVGRPVSAAYSAEIARGLLSYPSSSRAGQVLAAVKLVLEGVGNGQSVRSSI